MKKPHVLFVTEKYCDCNPGGSLTNSFHNLFGSLDCSELATHTNFFFEDHIDRMDDNLIRKFRDAKPDLAVITLLPGYQHNPTSVAFSYMANVCPLVFIWFDIAHPSIKEMANNVESYSKVNVVLDAPHVANDKYIFLWTPQDTGIYKDRRLKRDIDVTFLGSVNGYEDRKTHLHHLLSRGVNVHQYGGQREHNLTPYDYATLIQRSKISLNFSKTRCGMRQTKGRLWEVTLCGALLMEDDNLTTNNWFQPMRDYVPFTSPDDLVDKANYYLTHPDEADEIAASGRLKATLQYSPRNWWNAVISKAMS